MDLRAIRDRLAGQAPSTLIRHPRPPGVIADFPALIVGDPTLIDFHGAFGDRKFLELPVDVIVARTVEDDGTGALDDYVNDLPAQLEAITPDGLWTHIAVQPFTGGYFDYQVQTRDGVRSVGTGARLNVRITPT